MYKIIIKDLALLKLFLMINDTDYVDIVLNDEQSSMIVNTGEIFSVLNLKTFVKSDKNLTENDKIRIPKIVLSKFIREGSIEIEINSETISATLLNDKDICYCKMNFEKQNFPITGFKNKVEIINRAIKEQITINLEEFDSLDKLIRSTKSVLNVGDGVAMLASYNSRIYKEVDVSYKFSVTAFGYGILKRCSQIIYDMDNYLIARNKSLFIMVNKCRGFSNEEYPLFKEQKASMICEVDLTEIKDFISKISVDCALITLNIRNRISIFNAGNVIYEIPIKISKLNSVSEKVSDITIPKALFQEVLFNLNLNKVIIAKKKTFTQIRIDDVLVVF